MDFELTDDQREIRDLAGEIFADRVTPDRLKEVEAGREGWDRDLWGRLGSANLLGVALPQDVDGGGFGFLELCLVLEQAASVAAAVPLLSGVVMAALPIAAFGTAEQRSGLFSDFVLGIDVLTAAMWGDTDLTATRDGERWRIRGIADQVPVADAALRVVAPARTEDGAMGVFLLDPAAATLERQDITTGEPAFRMTVDAAVEPADVLAEPPHGDEVVRWTLDRATAAACVMQVGSAESALRLTAEYTSGRTQFDRPLASFQAVQQRIADMYIDTLAMRWTAWRAVGRLGDDLPADEEIAVAKFWASEGGARVVTAAQHLHGGMGVDVDYPLHRFTKQSKRVELLFGAATAQLARLGDLIAR